MTTEALPESKCYLQVLLISADMLRTLTHTSLVVPLDSSLLSAVVIL